MLKLQFRDRRREAVWLVDQVFTVGKAPTNSLMIDDQSIQDFHAEILSKGNQLSISNKASSASLWVNNKLVEDQTTLNAEDIIKLGDIELELIDPKSLLNVTKTQKTSHKNLSNSWIIHSKASWLEQNIFPIDGKVVIGRDPECDITLPLEHLSRKHLELELRSGHLFIKDLGSSNGTFLNGQRVTESEIKAGDKIKLDVLTFEVSGPAHDPNKTIIRTAPSPQKTSPAQDKKQEEKTLDKKRMNKPSPTGRKRNIHKPAKKRLAAEGKQDWISNDEKIGKQQKSKTGIVILSIFLLAILGLAIFFLKT